MTPGGSLKLIGLLYASLLPCLTNAQFVFTTNTDGSLNISNYTGSGATVIIPDATNGLRITSIGSTAFGFLTTITRVNMGTNIASIGAQAFQGCLNLVSVNIPDGVTNIGGSAFSGCISLTAATIPNGLTSLESATFYQCTNLSSVTVGTGVTNITGSVFNSCSNLRSVYFKGNAPAIDAFSEAGAPATAYFLPGTSGWGPKLGILWPTVLWNPHAQTGDASFGVGTNGFGFTIAGSSNLVIVVESSTNLANQAWVPISTNTLDTFIGTNGTSYFSDPQWLNDAARFYRLRSP